jgi:hypothetical protein
MKTGAFIHPLWQSTSFLVGLYNAYMGITRRGFTLTRHRSVGLTYYGMTSLGFIGGYAAAESLRIDMDLHLITGIIILILFATAGTLGFRMLADPAKIVKLRPIHKWINLTSLVLFLFQGTYGYFYLFTM